MKPSQHEVTTCSASVLQLLFFDYLLAVGDRIAELGSLALVTWFLKDAINEFLDGHSSLSLRAT